jgi:hypothetical protein
MDDNDCEFLVCKSPEDMKFAQDAEAIILEGLGNNILLRSSVSPEQT